MSYFIKQSTASRPLLFLMIDSSDHISAKTGLTPTVTISKSGASFASPAGTVTEVGSGWYQVAANATDSNTLGPIILHATASGADPTDTIFRVVAFDPDSATNLGLSNLDALISSRSTFSGGAVASVTAPVTVGTNSDKTGYTVSTVSDKTGYKLANDGLDSISVTLPSGAIGTWNFRERLVMLFRRFFGKATVTTSQIKTYAANGTTVLSTQSIAEASGTQTQGEAA